MNHLLFWMRSVTTLLRMFILHKGMLEWVTAAHTVRVFGRNLESEGSLAGNGHCTVICHCSHITHVVLFSADFAHCRTSSDRLDRCALCGCAHQPGQIHISSKDFRLHRSANFIFWRVPPGFTSNTLWARKIAGCHRITSRKIRADWWHITPRPPTLA